MWPGGQLSATEGVQYVVQLMLQHGREKERVREICVCSTAICLWLWVLKGRSEKIPEVEGKRLWEAFAGKEGSVSFGFCLERK